MKKQIKQHNKVILKYFDKYIEVLFKLKLFMVFLIGPTCKLQNRLLFHLSHKFNDEKRLMSYHHNLQDVIEDQVIINSIIFFIYKFNIIIKF